MSALSDFTHLLTRWGKRGAGAVNWLFPLVYHEANRVRTHTPRTPHEAHCVCRAVTFELVFPEISDALYSAVCGRMRNVHGA